MSEEQANKGKLNNFLMIGLGVGLLIFISFTLFRLEQQPQEPAKVGSLKKMINEEAEKKEAELEATRKEGEE